MQTLRHYVTKCTAAKPSSLGVKVLGIPNKRIEIFSHGKAVEYGQSYNTFKEKEKQDPEFGAWVGFGKHALWYHKGKHKAKGR